MAQKQTQKKPRATFEQRLRRRNQVIFLVLSGVLIVSMIISLIRW